MDLLAPCEKQLQNFPLLGLDGQMLGANTIGGGERRTLGEEQRWAGEDGKPGRSGDVLDQEDNYGLMKMGRRQRPM